MSELNDVADKWNFAYHRIIKMKPTDVKIITYIDFDVKNMIKILHLTG